MEINGKQIKLLCDVHLTELEYNESSRNSRNPFDIELLVDVHEYFHSLEDFSSFDESGTLDYAHEQNEKLRDIIAELEHKNKMLQEENTKQFAIIEVLKNKEHAPFFDYSNIETIELSTIVSMRGVQIREESKKC